MRKLLIVFLFAFVEGFSQGVLPVSRYAVPQQPILNVNTTPTSFAYSLRKLRSSYNGHAIRVRNINNNSAADISFDNNDLVSDLSNAVIVAAGASSYSVGQTVPLSTFRGSGNVSVEIWYNQNVSGYNAVQNVTYYQPILDLTAGPASLPAMLFSPNEWYESKFLVVQGSINSIVPGGRGSFLMVTKPTANIQQGSFGTIDYYANWRWMMHLNWDDQNLYLDAGESCCQNNRSVYNGDNINVWKQYSFVRDTYTKNIRTNAAERVNNPASVQATQSPYNPYGFGIGVTLEDGYPGSNAGYQGAVSELIMYNRALSSQEIVALEVNQMKYWRIN